MAVVDNVARNAPAGSETAVVVMKNAVASANTAMETVQRAVKQATDVAQSNFQSMTDSALAAGKAVPTPGSKKR